MKAEIRQIFAAEVRGRAIELAEVIPLLAAGAAGFLAGRLCVGGELAPFGTALICAAFLQKKGAAIAWLAFVGVLAGLVSRADALGSVAYHFACVSGAAVGMAIISRTRLPKKRYVAIACAVLASAAAASAFRRTLLLGVVTTAVETGCCAMLIPVIDNVFEVFSARRRLYTETEALCAVFCLLCCVAAVGDISIFGVRPANAAAVYLCLLCAGAGGAALGAGAGAAAGLAAVLGGADVLFMANLTACGLLAGMCRSGKKPGISAVFLVLNGVLTFYLNGSAFVIIPLVDSALGIAAFCLTKNSFLAFLRRCFDANLNREREQSLHMARFRRMTLGRLRGLSRLLAGTGAVFASERPVQSVAFMLSALPEAACEGCTFQKTCWEREFDTNYAHIRRLYAKSVHGGTLIAADLPRELRARCMRQTEVLRAIRGIFERYEKNSEAERLTARNREVVAEQLTGASRVIDKLCAEVKAGPGMSAPLEKEIRRELDRLGILADEICAGESEDGAFAELRLRACEGRELCRGAAAAAVSRACGRKMCLVRPESCTGSARCLLKYEQERPYLCATAVFSIKKDGSDVSGDAACCARLPGGRQLLLLCDGMGSGRRAAAESETAVRLMQDFLRAGFEERTVVDSINRLLILSSSDEVYSTMDICIIDADDGGAVFTKIGAPQSYIVRAGELMRIEAGALPIGIVEECEPARRSLHLKRGDVIFMMTDGAADAPEELLARAVLSAGADPEAAARAVAEAVTAAGQGRAADDITVIAAAVGF